MSHKPIDVIKQPTRRYEAAVLLPLVFVTVFCFGVVLMHPYYKPQKTNTTANTSQVSSKTQPSTHTVYVEAPTVAHLSTAASIVPTAASSATTPKTGSNVSQPISPATIGQSTNANYNNQQQTEETKLNTPLNNLINALHQALRE